MLNIANNRQDLPIIEVSHMPNMRFLSLNPLKCPKNSLVYTWPLVAAGQVFSTSMLDSLYCHVFFFSGILKIFQTLAHRSPLGMDRQMDCFDCGFDCIPIPDRFVGKTYGAFWDFALREHETVCLGLYRIAQGGLRHPFCYTNPRRTALLIASDKAFVLCPSSLWPRM